MSEEIGMVILNELRGFKKSIEERMDRLEVRMDNMESRIDNMDKKVDDNRVSSIKGITDVLDRMEKSISKQFKEINDRLDKAIEDSRVANERFERKFLKTCKLLEEHDERITYTEEWIEEFEENNGVAI